MKAISANRRSLLTLAAAAALLPRRVLAFNVPSYAVAKPGQLAPSDAPPHVIVAGTSEPGPRMAVQGRVTDGKNPVRGASIFVYHTDANGRYDPNEPRPGEGADNARLRGFMRSDAKGGYSFESIRPAPYPTTTLPEHVHYVVLAEGFKEDRVLEFWFADDPLIQPPQREGQARFPDYFYISEPMQDTHGIWHITHDIVLERA